MRYKDIIKQSEALCCSNHFQQFNKPFHLCTMTNVLKLLTEKNKQYELTSV